MSFTWATIVKVTIVLVSWQQYLFSTPYSLCQSTASIFSALLMLPHTATSPVMSIWAP
jgi:hypothetical protein